MSQDIIGKAMLVRLSISQFNPTRTDKSATSEVLTAKQASKGAAAVRKLLLPKESTTPISKLATEIRNDFNRLTLPWGEEGVRLLPTALWLDFMELMSRHREVWNKRVEEFIDDYATHRQQAMRQLGLLFNAQDYPDTNMIRTKFAVRTSLLPLPKTDDFRLSLAAEDMEELESNLEEWVREGVTTANQDLYKRLAEKLQKISERLSDPENIFRDSMIEGLRDLCNLLPGLNVTNDVELEKIREQVTSRVTSFDPQDLRDDDTARSSAKQSADEILRKMGIIVPVHINHDRQPALTDE